MECGGLAAAFTNATRLNFTGRAGSQPAFPWCSLHTFRLKSGSETPALQNLFLNPLPRPAMKKTAALCLSLLALAAISRAQTQVDPKYQIHDPNRPTPPIINPGTASTQETPGHPPSDAVILFDGKDLSKWQHKDGSAAKWKVENGYFEVVPKTGQLYTNDAFGDCQLHVEFNEPQPAKGQ